MKEIKRMEVPGSALGPQKMQMLARVVAQYRYFDGIVLHTMPWDLPFYGMALTLMLKNFRPPVVLYALEDQVEEAVAWAEQGATGVFALGSDGFDLACRTTCTRSGRVVSPGYPQVGRTDGWTHEVLHDLLPPREPDPFLLCDALNENVWQLFPGTELVSREDLLQSAGVLVPLVEFERETRWLLEEQREMFSALHRRRIPVVVTGLPDEVEDPLLRRALLRTGVVSAGDMTREAALVKLMWTLARTNSVNGVRMYFSLSFGGELTQGEEPI
jgi:L-asparaginase